MSFVNIPGGYVTPNGNVVMSDGRHGIITPNKNIIINDKPLYVSTTPEPTSFLRSILEAKKAEESKFPPDHF